MTILQNTPLWGDLQLGDGDIPIKVGGCLLCVLCEAARRKRTRPEITPPHANNALRKASTPPSGPCFVNGATGQAPGSDLVVARAAPVLGLSSPQDELVVGDAGDPALAAAVAKGLDAGDFMIIHVDFNKKGAPQHFVLAIERLSDGKVFCTDSAVGSVVLSPAELEGIARGGPREKGGWAEPRVYRARGVRPIRAILSEVVHDFNVGEGSPDEAAVKDVQQRLNDWTALGGILSVAGTKLVVDGDFGKKTKAMVEAFQEAQGLEVDGFVGPLTSARLLSPR